MSCPHCLEGDVADECHGCGASLNRKHGIPSVVDRDEPDPEEGRLLSLADADGALPDRLAVVREGYEDGRVVDQFLKTRTACWRLLVSATLSGRGLVVGAHDGVVGLVLGELLEAVHVADGSLSRLRALEAVANAWDGDVDLFPLHATLETLPYPQGTFDVVALDCRADQVEGQLSRVEPLLARDGAVLLLVDGWPREAGLTRLAGMGAPRSEWPARLRATLNAVPWRLSRDVRQAGLVVERRYALLSTSRHENARAFPATSEGALDWLLGGPGTAATTPAFTLARLLARAGRRSGVIGQCYPRHLLVCRRDGADSGDLCSEEGILVAGKNRSTLLQLQDGAVASVRKVPNSQRQAALHEHAAAAMAAVTGPVAETIPAGELRQTAFGPERHEEPVTGTTLDRRVQATPESVDDHLGVVLDWVAALQRATTSETGSRTPQEVASELADERFELSPPAVERTVEFPRVVSHGDLFGSNVYLDSEGVTAVIDWEWATVDANPVIDSGFVTLQLAEHVCGGFEEGFETMFLENERYASVLRRRLRAYCDAVDLTPACFVAYLPVGYLSRARRDLELNGRLDVDWPARVRHVWAHHDELLEWFTVER